MTLSNVGRGSDALLVAVNGSASEFTSTGTDTQLDIELLDGPLYIGGHPNIADIQVYAVNRLLYLCVCLCVSSEHAT